MSVFNEIDEKFPVRHSRAQKDEPSARKMSAAT